jgi:cytochrome c-type biogenesis protein CcmH
MPSGSKTAYGIAALAAVAVFTSGLVLYWKLAARDTVSASPANPHAAAPDDSRAEPAPPGTAQSMEVATDGLARRLKEKGGTADEWGLLARSYMHLQRYPEAVDAYNKALERSPGDPALIAGQAAARQATGMAPSR